MIKKIYFENFKSFSKAEILIENLTTLIGTNASGKTNMVEGMLILSEALSGRELSAILDGTKNSRSGIRGGARGCCRFESDYFILGCTVGYDESIDLEYRIKIKVKDRIVVGWERMSEIADGEEKVLFCTKSEGECEENFVVTCLDTEKEISQDIICVRFYSVISQIAAKLPQSEEYAKKIAEYAFMITNDFKNILFLDPEIHQMRGYSFINDVELKRDASNISSVLYALCKNESNKKLLLDIMQQLPENKISDITFSEGPLNDVILFLEEKVGEDYKRIDAVRLSDGTLRCLAVVGAVLSEKKGGVIVIEEVDDGIHPGRAKKLIHLLADLARARGVDVIITTHNAVLLNALSRDELAGVEIVYRDEDEGDGRFIPLIKIKRMPALLANGKLGDVFTSDMILQYIKQDETVEDYSWLED